MTDPTLPVRPPEPAAPRRKLRKKWIVAVVGVVLAVGGAAYGVHAKGDAEAKAYAKALDAWNDQKNDLLGAPSEANRVLWDFEDSTTKASLASQKTACDDVETLRKAAKKNAAAVPEAPDSIFKVLSSAERKAIKASEARKKAVNAYTRAADKVMVQLHQDCTWNIRANSADEGDSGSKKVYEEAEKLELKSGHSEGAYYCPSEGEGDCLPATAAKRTKYAELTLKAIKLDKTYVMSHYFEPGACEATSYGELCGPLKKNIASFFGTSADYSTILKGIDPTSSKVGDEFDHMEKLNKSADKAFREALFKARPQFKSNPRVSDNVFWREAYFDAVATASIQDLDELRTAVLKER